MDKDKLFDKIQSERDHYCRFICGKKSIVESVEVEIEFECFSIDVDVEICDLCPLKDFVKVLEREIQVDKLDKLV